MSAYLLSSIHGPYTLVMSSLVSFVGFSSPLPPSPLSLPYLSVFNSRFKTLLPNLGTLHFLPYPISSPSPPIERLVKAFYPLSPFLTHCSVLLQRVNLCLNFHSYRKVHSLRRNLINPVLSFEYNSSINNLIYTSCYSSAPSIRAIQ